MTEISETKELESLDVNGIGLVEPGLHLEHPSLGVGVVENIYKLISTGEINIKVKFNDYGSKNINPKHAHLTLVANPDTNSFVGGILKAAFSWLA